MATRLTHITVEGEKIVAHYRQEFDELVMTPENRPDLQDWWDRGFVKIVLGFGGFHIGLKKDGKWHEVDFIEDKVLRERKDPFQDNTYVLARVVPEGEWGPWVNKIPVKRVKSRK